LAAFGRFQLVLTSGERALKIFTLGGAYAMNQEDRTGSIRQGKAADFIVPDRNLFEIPPEKIHETRVLTTVLEGEVIYPSG
jgi:predicted amidohydrolase YtcJ